MVGTELANLTNKKAFVHRAFRRASEEPDVQIKREIKKIMADNFKIYLLEGEKIQTENGFRRPDLIDRKRKLVEVIDVLGQKGVNPKPNAPLFYRYDDGTVEKRIIIE